MCLTCQLIEDMGNRLLLQEKEHTLYAIIEALIYQKDGKLQTPTLSGILPLNYCPQCGAHIVHYETNFNRG